MNKWPEKAEDTGIHYEFQQADYKPFCVLTPEQYEEAARCVNLVAMGVRVYTDGCLCYRPDEVGKEANATILLDEEPST